MKSRIATGVVVANVGPEWILVPGRESFASPELLQDWAASAARAKTLARPEAFEWLSLSLTAVAASGNPDELRAVYLPSVEADLALVRVIAAGHDTDTGDLALAVGVEDPAAIETPIVEPFTAAGLGEGVRAVRFHVGGEDRSVTGIVAYAFAVAGTVVRVSYADADLTRLTNLSAIVDDFVGAITMQYGEPPTR
ncbi:hypothetical protein [Curtobacterium flaccumfaciens]|uniref:hypothetical protein n=1 Tax=Curtobacterium flaccumfaciens TaxID=2035 RepID=UPI001AD9C3D0|nr:hypothetical protein [Curtobacterium flaccumfaciens]MBO9040836.1 hypothetical protein [Curtobacterium flaccumfaciens pv. flaccumfaciens]